MNLPRFFLPTLKPHSALELSEGESHHLARVLRLQAGAKVEVFDGRGSRGVAVVESVHKKTSIVETGTIETCLNRRETQIAIATSLPKGDRQKWLIEKLTELGIDQVILLETERGVAQPTDNALERLERVAVEACKQSRNDWVVKIDSPVTLRELTSRLNPDIVKLLAHPYSVGEIASHGAKSEQDSNKKPLGPQSLVVPGIRALQQWLPDKPPSKIIVAVGPEGGFTNEEVEFALKNQWLAWVLTQNILRVETAVLMSAILVLDFVTHS